MNWPHSLDDEDERLQRGLARGRLAPLISYLTEVPDHFFSALTLIILPRDLDRQATEAFGALSDGHWDYYFEKIPQAGPGREVAGVIHLSGAVRLFPADGQHRLRAAIDALKLSPDLAREEVPVVLIPYRDRDQIRQLFADLNLNAKPVNKTVGYALDSRDRVARLAKSVGAEVPLFKGRVNRMSNSLPRSSAHVITLNTLVECTRILMAAWFGVQDRPGLDEAIRADLTTAQRHALEAWRGLVEPFLSDWQPVVEGVPGSAGRLREEYVFPHGLGWLSLATFAAELYTADPGTWLERFKTTVTSIDWSKKNPAWEGVATLGGAVNNTASAVKATARFLATSSRRRG